MKGLLPPMAPSKVQALLSNFPRERWKDRTEQGDTLLHLLCKQTNTHCIRTVLASGLVDVNAYNHWGQTALHYAIQSDNHEAAELLLAAGAWENVCDDEITTPIEIALGEGNEKCAFVLIAYGVRLRSVDRLHRGYITPTIDAFEKIILNCRSAVVAMLYVKRAGNLWRWDKFLLKEIALCIWASKYDW